LHQVYLANFSANTHTDYLINLLKNVSISLSISRAHII